MNTDACVAEGVTLHVVDRVLVPGMETIATILERNFTLFAEALMFTRVFDFLDKEDKSRTVFVPTDEAFAAQIPPNLLACLMYRRLPLSDLVLYHITDGAEYTSSLSLREFTYTLLQYHAIHLTTSPDGVITFSNNPPSNIIVADIPASNGVIHVVDSVLIPPNMDFGMCSDFVPTTAPPVTTPEPEVPTTLGMMTDPEMTAPPEVNTDDVPVTDPEMTTPPEVTTDDEPVTAPSGVSPPPTLLAFPDDLLRLNP